MASQNGLQAALVERQGIGSKDFETLNMIGEGAFAKVSLVRKAGGNDNGFLYADKEMSKELVMKKAISIQHTLAEREVMEAVLGCPFLVQMHYAYQTNTSLHFIMDFVNGGQLFEHLLQHGYFEESEVRIYAAEITVALQTLHELGILYRDLKPENVLLDCQGHVVLADFGLCKKFPLTHPTKRSNSFCGTPMYMSPEMILDGPSHSYETDWYSLGILVYELLVGISPFWKEDDDVEDTYQRVLNGIVEYPKYLTRTCKMFIKKLLCKNPADRLGAGGAEEVKAHRFFRTVDWDKLVRKEVPAPFIPEISHALDLGNFDSDLVNAPIRKSQSCSPAIGMDIFKDFSYTAPWTQTNTDGMEQDTVTDMIIDSVTAVGDDEMFVDLWE